MIAAHVVRLRALQEGTIVGGTGRAVHGLWFRVWGAVAPQVAADLHRRANVPPFTLSPLMGLPRPSQGRIAVAAGQEAWFRVVTLTESLTAALAEQWLPALPATVELAGIPWAVLGNTVQGDAHPWAGRASYRDLAAHHLGQRRVPRRWRLHFITPTAFHGAAGHVPFPLPEGLVRSWLRRWNVFAPLALPADLPDQVRSGVVVSAYRLQTVPVRHGARLVVGAVGWLTLYAVDMHPALRAALDLLAHYAFYCGSGAKTTQGMGLTR